MRKGEIGTPMMKGRDEVIGRLSSFHESGRIRFTSDWLGRSDAGYQNVNERRRSEHLPS